MDGFHGPCLDMVFHEPEVSHMSPLMAIKPGKYILFCAQKEKKMACEQLADFYYITTSWR